MPKDKKVEATNVASSRRLGQTEQDKIIDQLAKLVEKTGVQLQVEPIITINKDKNKLN
tara:strand:- start:316 stop:489 length:174 start_codon:yes stop_codon:yes gene_type:complete